MVESTLATLSASTALGVVAYVMTSSLVEALGPNLVAKGLSGRDMLKKTFRRDSKEQTAPLIPEATGVIGASVYILLLSLFAPLPYLSHFFQPGSMLPSLNTTVPASSSAAAPLQANIDFPHHSFATYLASLLSLLIATFLGFADDVFDIRWRWKLPIPIIASVPLLVTYAAAQGLTDVVVPRLFSLRKLFAVESTNGVLRLGVFYYVYMALLSTFCTNSINILAGINGVEVSQGLVIALSIIVNDLLYVTIRIPFTDRTATFGLARGSQELADRHLFSLYFMLPLVGICIGLLRHNWFPARAFVGDTFCYFAGMAFAVVGILGHFSKTLLLFFMPQIFNFVYSTPQLFGVIPCPRHRLPWLNYDTGRLEPSYAVLKKRPGALLSAVLSMLATLRLLKIKRDEKGQIIETSNWTILNLLLINLGPMTEAGLCQALIACQVAGSVVGLGIRYGATALFYDASRL